VTEAGKIQITLALELGENDAGATTFRDYLTKLLTLVWQEEEMFDGKRPFGNSGWKEELYRPMIAAGLAPGELDEDGYAKDVDEDAVDGLVFDCIAALDYRTKDGVSAL
jgi:hypothetical protein